MPCGGVCITMFSNKDGAKQIERAQSGVFKFEKTKWETRLQEEVQE